MTYGLQSGVREWKREFHHLLMYSACFLQNVRLIKVFIWGMIVGSHIKRLVVEKGLIEKNCSN